MFSYSIIKFKPHVSSYTPPPFPPRTGGLNKSYLTNDWSLGAFLNSAPSVGDWCWRKSLPTYETDTPLTESNQCQYVIRVLNSLHHAEMTYDRSSGFPQTHEIITAIPYTTGQHYRRFVDIRDYEVLSEEQLKRFISAELQNSIQSLVAPGTYKP